MTKSNDDKKAASTNETSVEPRIVDELFRRSADRFVGILEKALERRHDFFVVEAARRLQAMPGRESPRGGQVAPAAAWIEVASLSQLRGIVGGRFQMLRDRWVAAGFPLREHRGDREGPFSVDPAGWLELSAWIAKQGYEARLTPDKPGSLFELRSAA